MDGKKADIARPGIGSYQELEKILPDNYSSLVGPASFAIGRYFASGPSKTQAQLSTDHFFFFFGFNSSHAASGILRPIRLKELAPASISPPSM